MAEGGFIYRHHPHDAFVKRVLGMENFAKSFFQEVLPASIVVHLDLDQLVLTRDSFIDDQHQGSQADILLQTTYRGDEALV